MADMERGPSGEQGGSDLNVLHTERDMNVYVLTEPELDRLGELNSSAAGFSSLATFFAAFALDLYKDEALAQNIPEATRQALELVQLVVVILAAAFAIAALCYWVKRGLYQSRIKRDSKSKSRVRGEVRTTPASDEQGGSP